MKLPVHLYFVAVLIFITTTSSAQKLIKRDIKSFGAKGDGKTNDHDAFRKAAAYFNARGGNGTLIISKGIYIIGKQTFNGGKPDKQAYDGENVLHFTKVNNLKVVGNTNATLKYKDSLRFGAFDPGTGMVYEHADQRFYNISYAAAVGTCIQFENCSNVSVSGVTIDGNSKEMVLGGTWGDVGRQLTHYGFFIVNSRSVTIDRCNVYNMALDGINVCNKLSDKSDKISISNSSFQFNARQGLSYTGGNNLVIKNCKFSNSGKGAFASAPCAGVDIEAECGPAKNGYFTDCEFINNTGVGLLANTGEDSNCTFTRCTFWGVTSWSIWVTKPRFTFNNCSIYGSIVWGYNSPDDGNATKYIGCTFEDKPYKGVAPYGNFIIESNGTKRVSFSGCKFITNKKNLSWIVTDPKLKPEEKYQFTNCSFVIKNPADSNLALLGVMRGMVLKNCTFEFKHAKARARGLSFINTAQTGNVDLGGNKIVDPSKK